MADQRYSSNNSEFFLDLHGTTRAEAKRTVRVRIAECFKYGIECLKVVYGSPDEFQGSIAEAIFQLIKETAETSYLALEMLPSYVFMPNPRPEFISTYVRLYLSRNDRSLLLDSDTVFSPFTPKYERDLARRLRCKTPYFPLRTEYTLQWASRAIGHGCTPEILTSLLKRPSQKSGNQRDHVTWSELCELAVKYKTRPAATFTEVQNIFDSQTNHEIDRPSVSDDMTDAAPNTETYNEIVARALHLEEQSHYSEAELLLTELLTATPLSSELEDEAFLSLGRVKVAMKQRDGETTLLQALELRKTRGPRGTDLLPNLEALAMYYRQSGEYERASAMLAEASEIAEAGHRIANASEVIAGYLQSAELAHFAGRHKDSLDTLKELSGFLPRQLTDFENAIRFDLLGLNHLSVDSLLEAELAFQSSVRYANKSEMSSEGKACILMHRGRLKRKREQFAEAIHLYEEAADILRQSPELSDGFLEAQLLSSRAVALKCSGQEAEAKLSYNRAIELFQMCGATEHPEYAKSLQSRAVLLLSCGDVKQAEQDAQLALEIAELKVSSDSTFRLLCSTILEEIAEKI
ncbi:MAG: hypothetical protein ABI286_02925 [Edaphobacter sp.]